VRRASATSGSLRSGAVEADADRLCGQARAAAWRSGSGRGKTLLAPTFPLLPYRDVSSRNGDVAVGTRHGVEITTCGRRVAHATASLIRSSPKGGYRHFMLRRSTSSRGRPPHAAGGLAEADRGPPDIGLDPEIVRGPAARGPRRAAPRTTRPLGRFLMERLRISAKVDLGSEYPTGSRLGPRPSWSPSPVGRRATPSALKAARNKGGPSSDHPTGRSALARESTGL